MTPRVTVGIPVYNGAKYLGQAIESVLAQTFTDFELIICDNASTDATAAIALEYAARDARVRYTRNRENIGAQRNFNRVFELSTGEYFKWMAADDLIKPEFLKNCVAALEAEPGAVLAYTRGAGIDASGTLLKHCQHPVSLEAQKNPVSRFRLFRERSGFSAWPFLYVFGLMRRDVVTRTRLQGVHTGGDSSFLYEMLLAGSFVEVPLHLSTFRLHEESFSGMQDHKKKTKFLHGNDSWVNKALGERRLYFEYLVNILRSPVTGREKLAILKANLQWMRRRQRPIPEQSLLAPLRGTR